MSIKAALFRLKNQKWLPLLEGRVEVCRVGRRTLTDFYLLARDLQSYRDFIRDHLDTLPIDERGAAEDELWPGVKALVEKVGKVVDEGLKAGVIDEALYYDTGMLGNSLLFVSAFSKLGTEPTSQNFNPRRR